MDIIQTFYDNMATHYDKLFLDWAAATREQANILESLFRANGFDRSARILDCACGIGTQAIGLAALGYCVTASDISDAELAEAKRRAQEQNVSLHLAHADFCALSDTFSDPFDLVICMDNALPHMLTAEQLDAALAASPDRSRPAVYSLPASAITMLYWTAGRRIPRPTFTSCQTVSAFPFRRGTGRVTTTG